MGSKTFYGRGFCYLEFDPCEKTLLSDKISFKVDILEEEARAIPELNHYFISWNVYIVPTVSSSNMEKKLLRSTTQTDLVVQYNMKQLNVNGEMTGKWLINSSFFNLLNLITVAFYRKGWKPCKLWKVVRG